MNEEKKTYEFSAPNTCSPDRKCRIVFEDGVWKIKYWALHWATDYKTITEEEAKAILKKHGVENGT